MTKKEIDVLELMRESVLRANKELGFLKEQNLLIESKFSEPFSPEKHMPKFEVSKNWGTSGGTLESQQIDAIVKNIVDPGQKNGLERYKQAISKMNSIFGEVEKKEGELEAAPEEKQVNITEIISSLQIKNIIHSIINNKDPQTAGKLYELIMARIAGGFVPGEITTNIADFIDGEGNFVSLKTLKKGSDTRIKGSKFNLATAIAKKGKVTFLVCLKDKEPDTFKLETYSFSVNKDNYFNFILGTEKNVNMNAVLSEMDFIEKRMATVSQDIQITRKQKLAGKKTRELDLDALKTKLKPLKAKRGNIQNQKVTPAQKAFEAAAEGTPEKEAARQKLEGALKEKEDNEQLINDLETEITRREEEISTLSAAKREAGEKTSLKESLAVTDVMGDIAADSALATNIYQLLFPQEANVTDKTVRKYFMNILTNFSNEIKKNEASTKLLENILKTVGKVDWQVQEIPAEIIQASGKKFMNLENLKTLDSVIEHIKQLSGLELAIEVETDPATLGDFEKLLYKQKTLTPEEENRITGILKEKESGYTKIKQDIQKAYRPFIEAYTQFANTKIDKKNVSQAAPKLKAGDISMIDYLGKAGQYQLATKKVGDLDTPVYGAEVLEKVNSFWDNLSGFEGYDVEKLEEANSPEKVAGDTQFYISIPKSKEIAEATKGGDLDENYPTVFVTGRNLKDSSSKSAKLFKDWAEPLYAGMHYLTNGVNQYFIEDDPAGLTLANNSTNEISKQVSNIQQAGLKATQLKESKDLLSHKKQVVKKDVLDDILEDLLS